MENFFKSIFSDGVNYYSFFIVLLVSLVVGFVFAIVSKYKSNSTKSFYISTAIMPACVSMVIMLVNGNIGAGVALGVLEKLNITSKACRAIGMVSGIILTGVIGGSKIANYITDKVSKKVGIKDIKERKPELIDLGMHTDDIATVAVLSGLKWIEPSLPFLYSISGYKSGIGYRN